MNRTKIEYVDYSWNPVVGCLHGCPYCYARRLAERGFGEYGKYEKGSRFLPRFFPERLQEPMRVKNAATILVCSMGDLWGKWVPAEWQEGVLDVIRLAPQHTFLLLTKWHWGYANRDFPENAWAGVTVTGEVDAGRLDGLHKLVDETARKWVSYEPVLGPFPVDLIAGIDWLVIGAQTGPGAVPPNPEWIEDVLGYAKGCGIPVFMKDNLAPYWPGKLLRDTPWSLGQGGGEDAVQA